MLLWMNKMNWMKFNLRKNKLLIIDQFQRKIWKWNFLVIIAFSVNNLIFIEALTTNQSAVQNNKAKMVKHLLLNNKINYIIKKIS